MNSVRVLVVDDSSIFADAIACALQGDPAIQVVGCCGDGAEAIEQTRRLRPDIITMDLHMPVLGGLEAIERIMTSVPTPILVMTADAGGQDGTMALEALRRGAIEVALKPDTWPASAEAREALQRQVKLLATVPAVYRPNRARAVPAAVRPMQSGSGRLVVMAASTGGPLALVSILSALPADYPFPVVIVQHLAAGFAPTFASWLGEITPLRVGLAHDRLKPAGGEVWIAPDDRHTVFRAGGMVTLERSGPVRGHCPSADRLFESAALVYGRGAIGIVLTGMGEDGAQGLNEIRKAGGTTMAQDRASSAIYGMPKAALECGGATRSMSLEELGASLRRLAGADTGKTRLDRGIG